MQTAKNIVLDLQNKTTPPVLYAVQGDNLSRVVNVSLYQNGEAWEIPEGSIVSIAYKRPDGQKGWYDTLPNLDPATEITGGNTARLKFTLSVLAVPGTVTALVRIDSGASTLATFPFIVEVEENPSFLSGDKEEDYYNVTNWGEVNKSIEDILVRLSTVEAGGGGEGSGGGGSTVELDTTLTKSGKAADAKAVGDRMTTIEDTLVDVEESLGEIETALDSIIALQESLIGGES